METSGQKYITVEFNGTRKEILAEKLPAAREMESIMQAAARKSGIPQEEIHRLYTLRIVTDEA